MPVTSPASVVIPSAGRRPDSLVACLQSIEAQSVPHETIVVVPPGTSLPSEVEEVARVVEQHGSISAAMNAGIRSAAHGVVATTHDDCKASREWLRELVTPINLSGAAACVGQTVPSRSGRSYPATHVLQDTEPKMITTSKYQPFWELGLIGNNYAMRRDLVDRVGPFNESLGVGSRLRGGEDLDMFHRILAAGLPVCINPKALVYHEPLDTWHQEMRMWYGYRMGLAGYFYCHRRETGIWQYFVRTVATDHIRQLWRSVRVGRLEQLGMDVMAAMGLGFGLMKAMLYNLH